LSISSIEEAPPHHPQLPTPASAHLFGHPPQSRQQRKQGVKIDAHLRSFITTASLLNSYVFFLSRIAAIKLRMSRKKMGPTRRWGGTLASAREL
jgi:hypothetical protein